MRREAAHRPRKRFSQHFLTPQWAQRVVAVIAPAPGDVFLEIGPGTGALTSPLAATGVPVVAIEIDRDLAAELAARLPRNVTIVTGDVLKTDVTSLVTGLAPTGPPAAMAASPKRRYRVVGNLPYHVTSPILFHLIELWRRDRLFADATLMVQREVAERLAARPGTKAWGALSIHAQMHADTAVLLTLPPGAFRPAPKVHSAVVRFTFREPRVRLADEPLFDAMVRALFSQRRKTLTNALKAFDPRGPAAVGAAGLDGRRRPETLTLEELGALAGALAAAKRPVVL